MLKRQRVALGHRAGESDKAAPACLAVVPVEDYPAPAVVTLDDDARATVHGVTVASRSSTAALGTTNRPLGSRTAGSVPAKMRRRTNIS